MPTYNSEKTIENSIKSVIDQTYQNIELIIVNDGSTDNTEKIINKMISTDERIIYIYKKNGGVSSARNVGLDYATGNYISFIDSDDYYQKEMLQILMEYIKEYNSDLVSCSYEKINDERNVPEKTFLSGGYYDKRKLEEDIYPFIIADSSLDYTIPLNIVTKLYRKNIIVKYNIRFNEKLKFGEDLLFSKEYLLHANSFYYLPNYFFYKYCNNDYSVTNSIDKKREETIFYSLNSQNDIINKFPEYNLTKQLYYYRIRLALSTTANIIKYMKGSRNEILKEVNLVIDNEQIIEACEKVDPSNFSISKRIIYELIKRQNKNFIYILVVMFKFLK